MRADVDPMCGRHTMEQWILDYFLQASVIENVLLLSHFFSSCTISFHVLFDVFNKNLKIFVFRVWGSMPSCPLDWVWAQAFIKGCSFVDAFVMFLLRNTYFVDAFVIFNYVKRILCLITLKTTSTGCG